MTHTEQSQYIARVTKNVARAIRRWSANGQECTESRARSLVRHYFEGMVENENAMSNLVYVVFRYMRMDYTKQYETVFPPCYMDANGNYTYDSSKWV